jgi:transcriptional regulator with XRE-family HTH domain
VRGSRHGPAGRRPRPDGSFGALLRAFRHRAYLSQEQLAARAELSERAVRNLEAGRVRSPRNDTVRLLADALALTEPERESWVAAAQGANGRQTEVGLPGADGLAQPPRRVSVAVLTANAQDGSDPVTTWLIGASGQTLLVVHCTIRDVARHQLARLTLLTAQHARPIAVRLRQSTTPRTRPGRWARPSLTPGQVGLATSTSQAPMFAVLPAVKAGRRRW